MGPSLNLMLEAMPLFLFKSYFESLPYSKLMDWSIKLWLLLVCFSSTFCFPLFLVHIPTSSTPGLQNLLFVLKLKTEDCVKGNFLFLHEKNVLGTLIEDVSESSNDRCHHKKAINSHLSSWPVFLEICLTSLKSLKYFWRVLRWLRNIVFFFRKFGVEKFDPASEQFDLLRHNVVFQIPDLSKPFDTVDVVLKTANQMQPGSFNFSNGSK